MRLLTWNIGSFVFLKYQKYFRAGNFDHQEYFQPLRNASLVSHTIESIDPDFLFLQEFYYPSDSKKIDALRHYPFQKLIDTWYREKGALIASKKPFRVEVRDGVASVEYEKYCLFPVHLNSFFPAKRLEESRALQKLTAHIKDLIIFGDFNFWLRGGWHIWRSDRVAYALFTQFLAEQTHSILSSTCYGFGLDKIFTSSTVRVQNVASPSIRGPFMDHYPVYCDILI